MIWSVIAALGIAGMAIAYWMIFVGKVTATWGASLQGLFGGRVSDTQHAVDLALFVIPMVMTIVSLPATLWCAASTRGRRVLVVLYGLGVAAMLASGIYQKYSARFQQVTQRDLEQWLHDNLQWVIAGVVLLVIVLLAVIAVVLISIRRRQITSDRPASRHPES